ncbi:hypothetical protein [Brevundimonas sp.]|uniref:hypothetical protein n=1 Tax=Brevundimonas sp. TaxID=1871086 RepID=UPI002FCA11F7
MLALFAAAWLALAVQESAPRDPDPVPTAGPGEWMLLQHFYPGPTPGRGVDYWVSANDYGAGPNAEGLVRVRTVTPGDFDADLQPTRFMDFVREADCVNRRERTYVDGVPGDWQVLPDFVPGAQMIFDLCYPNGMANRWKEPSLEAALARSRELERLHRLKESRPHY